MGKLKSKVESFNEEKESFELKITYLVLAFKYRSTGSRKQETSIFESEQKKTGRYLGVMCVKIACSAGPLAQNSRYSGECASAYCPLIPSIVLGKREA